MTLATVISDDLKCRLATGTGPVRLTTTALARMYDVSTTPIRHALRILEEKRVVRQLPNGRWVVDPEFDARAVAATEEIESAEPRAGSFNNAKTTAAWPIHEPWRDDVVRWLLMRSLRGEGGFIRESVAAERFSIGRTRVRRVFQYLTTCGVLEHVPRRGWELRVFQHSDMTAYVDVREILELRALELARPNLERDRIEQMLAGNRDRQDQRLDNRLHDYFIERSGNRYIQKFFQTQGQYYRLLFDYAALEGRVMAQMAAQHREILEHVLRSHWARARDALSTHIRAQIPVIDRVVRQLRSRQRG